MNKTKILFVLSGPAVAAANYAVNLIVAIFGSSHVYANFLSQLSWVNFFAPLVTLGFVDLLIKKNRSDQEGAHEILNASVGWMLLVSPLVIFPVGYLVSGSLLFPISIVVFSFYRIFNNFAVYEGRKGDILRIRYLRVVGIFCVISLIAVGQIEVTSAEVQIALQALAAAISVALVAFYMKLKIDLKGLYALASRNLQLIGKRTGNQLIDLIHMPIFLTIFTAIYADDNGWLLYVVGLLFPLSFILSNILKEYYAPFLIDIMVEFKKYSGLTVVLSFLLVSLAIYLENFYLLALLISSLIVMSGLNGLYIYRLGLEAYDLVLNFLLSSAFLGLNFILLARDLIEPSYIALAAFLLLYGKYLLQRGILYFGRDHI
jgi:hypothetical protein